MLKARSKSLVNECSQVEGIWIFYLSQVTFRLADVETKKLRIGQNSVVSLRATFGRRWNNEDLHHSQTKYRWDAADLWPRDTEPRVLNTPPPKHYSLEISQAQWRPVYHRYLIMYKEWYNDQSGFWYITLYPFWFRPIWQCDNQKHLIGSQVWYINQSNYVPHWYIALDTLRFACTTACSRRDMRLFVSAYSPFRI